MGTSSGDGASIGVMDLNIAVADGGAATVTAANPRVVATPGQNSLLTLSGGTNKAYFPAFMPDGLSVIYHEETYGNAGGVTGDNHNDPAGTRSQCDTKNSPIGSALCQYEGVHAEMWWVPTSSETFSDAGVPTVTPLSNQQSHRLNCASGISDTNCPATATGTSYLPPHSTYTPLTPVTGTANYGADWNMTYEPTILPQAQGGYAWVVFTSRRLYGNIATMNPYWSDPRFEDLRTNATTKKLWVAAIDLNAPGGTDPSHPAFYLDGQELLAGNSRGFLVLNQCEQPSTTPSAANLCTSNLDCCTNAVCALDSPLPTPATSHCIPLPTGCVADGAACTGASTCCGFLNEGSLCSQQTHTCTVPPPSPTTSRDRLRPRLR